MSEIDITKLEQLRGELNKLRHPVPVNFTDLYFENESSIEKYSRRCFEYCDLVYFLERRIYPSDEEKFSDGLDMSDWFYKERKKYIEQAKAGLENLTNDAIIKRKLFEGVLEKTAEYEINLSFEDKVNQYLEKMKEMGRPIRSIDKFYFEETGKSMYNWFNWYNQKFSNKRKNEESLTEEELEQLMLLARIYDEIHNQRKLKLSNK